MRKLVLILLTIIFSLNLMGCESKSKVTDDPASVIENTRFSEGFDELGLFWNCQFDNMYISVIFKEDNPKKYFAQHSLQISQIKSIQIYPDKDKTGEFIYMIYDKGTFQIDQNDIKEFQDQGRLEAYETYQKKINDLSLTNEDIGNWMITYFNEKVRSQLISQVQKEADELILRMKKKGYEYQKEDSGRILILSDKEPYTVVISVNSCMIVDKKMNLDGGLKTGYMYNATLGSVGYIKDDQVMISYRYQDNTVLQGKPSQTQYREFMNVKKWYDQFLVELNTDTATLENL
ncbi:hypothetical protein [Candidatus Stoquefichus massiliensis]|uniref:hypothetical protein n=1 Tax=Candidatus Stoquefichus massiliensis TaxID=1470350 RepID=UPI0004834CF6|nr:hypothetical protein [Candidatus Stoquefichus massiliensis]